MFKTAKRMGQLVKSISVGLTAGQLQKKLARYFEDDKNDPLYQHWRLALDSLIVASRENFNEATKELIEELEAPRRDLLDKTKRVFKPSQN